MLRNNVLMILYYFPIFL
uniref:Uncharacterized protein n=1 Tax=Anguilla anguilla TaxID=7936 RepID=A0A0E9V9R7_ANGAN